MDNIDQYRVFHTRNKDILSSLVGKELTGIKFIKHKRYNPKAPMAKYHLCKFPIKVERFSNVGYHYFLHFEGVDLLMESFIKKKGNWSLERPVKGGVEFCFGDDFSVFFVDLNGRSVLKFRVIKTYKKLLKRLGIDLHETTLEKFEYVLRLRQNKYRSIGKVLFNDLQVTGINNYDISQMLYSAGLSPNRRTDKVTRDEMKIMLDCLQNEHFVSMEQLHTYINIGEDQVLYWNPEVQVKK